MIAVTEPLADALFNLSNIVLIIGAAAVLMGTIGAIAMGSAKEQFSNERISANEAETARAKADAAQANSRALEAQVELEKFKAPRTLTGVQREAIVKAITPFPNQKFSGMVASGVADAEPLWGAISATLEAGNWVRMPPWGLASGNPPAGIPVAPSDGITIFVPSGDIPALIPVATALATALKDAGLQAVVARDNGPQARHEIIVIQVGMKPQ